MKKAILTGLLFLFGFTFVHAQAPQTRQLFNLEKQLERSVLNAVKRRQDWQTVQYVSSALERGETIDGCMLSSIAADSAYMHKLSNEELGVFAKVLQQVDFDKFPGCGMEMALVAQQALKMASIEETAADFPLGLFYQTSLVILSRQKTTNQVVLNWAFERVGESSRYFTDIRREQVSVGYLQKDALLDPSDVRSTLWASLLLLTLAGQENPVFDRQNFEERLEEIISQFDWLKNEKAEYLTRFGRSNNEGRGKTNQSVMLSLFAQANNFLSLKDDESFLTSLISTGSFNSLLRKEGEERFSSDGELFYLHHPTPGTDGRGNVADSPNGRRHQILSGLIDALFISYSMRTEFSKASNLMESFVREYIAIRGGEFKHYLYIPLQAMRAGRALLNDQDARGWAAEAALQEELYKNLKEEYGIYVAVAYMQGVSEFAAECGIFWAAGEGLKWGGQGISKLWVKYVPKRTRVLLRKNIVDPIRRLRGKPSRAQLMSGRRIRTDIAREKSALQIQRRLGDLTEEEFLRYWDMLQQEQARELLLHGLTP